MFSRTLIQILGLPRRAGCAQGGQCWCMFLNVDGVKSSNHKIEKQQHTKGSGASPSHKVGSRDLQEMQIIHLSTPHGRNL